MVEKPSATPAQSRFGPDFGRGFYYPKIEWGIIRAMRLLSKLNLKLHRGEICLLRIDLNVEKEETKDNFRLQAILPTIRHLIKNDICVVLLSHRGRPKGHDQGLSLKPFVAPLSKNLKMPVEFIEGFDFIEVTRRVRNSPAKVFLMENLRFLPGEEKNDRVFAKKLASVGDFYVNDAFAVSHRANASVSAITKYIPSYAGLLLEREVSHLGDILKKQTHPFLMIIGGAKISDKLGVVLKFLKKIDTLLLGGGAANTFFASQRFPMGKSLVDWNSIPLVKKIACETKTILPIDTVILKEQVLDIGPRSAELFASHIAKARTIIWAGPPGYFAIKGCENGTRSVWQAVLKNKKAKIVVGGGETTAALKLVKNAKVPPNVFVSTGGGAMLDFLASKKLPGITCLDKTSKK